MTISNESQQLSIPLLKQSETEFENKTVMILSMSQDKQSISLAQKLREKKVSVMLLTDKAPSKSLDYANAKKIERVLIIGEDEVKNKKYKSID